MCVHMFIRLCMHVLCYLFHKVVQEHGEQLKEIKGWTSNLTGEWSVSNTYTGSVEKIWLWSGKV